MQNANWWIAAGGGELFSGLDPIPARTVAVVTAARSDAPSNLHFAICILQFAIDHRARP
jgi:hypothetical protein